MTATAVLEALADGTRRTIFEQLRDRPASVAELASHVPVSRPAVSQHLRVLLEAGLVTFEGQGRRNVYRVRSHGLHELRAWLDEFWQTALDRFEDYARTQAGIAGGDTT